MPNRMLVNLKNLSLSINNQSLIDNLSLSVHAGQLLAIMGANGCGKSTILKILTSSNPSERTELYAGDLKIDFELFVAPGIDISYLPQQITESGLSPSVEPESLEAKTRIRLRNEFNLGVTGDKDTAMSDGQRQKQAIVNALLGESHLYLFDEPTNYLDITGIVAFENQVARLKRKGAGIILITHDRTLTDNLADQTVLITKNGIYHTSGGATEAWSVKRSELEARAHKAKEIKKKIDQLQRDTQTKAGWAASKESQKRGAGAGKPHIGKLAKKMAKRSKVAQQRTEKEARRLEKTKPYIPKKVNLVFPEYQIRHRTVFSMQNLGFSYQPDSGEGENLLSDITIFATTQSKICLMGTNGAGKTTLLRLIQKEQRPTTGTCKTSNSVKIASVPQGLKDFYEHPILLDNFRDCGCHETEVRQYLGAALIRKDKACDPITSFSYGELMRAAIVKCVLSRAEFLLLDEPTSHLDLESIQVLEQLLGEFAGGFLLISHDRSFVSNVAAELYVLDNGHLKQA